MKVGKYIVIEGADGVGKTTAANGLAEYLRGTGKTVKLVSEGSVNESGLEFSDKIGEILHDTSFELENRTEILLFTAIRTELWHKVIWPALEAGTTVISTRNWLSMIAYQGFGNKFNYQRILKFNKMVMAPGYIRPDKTFLLVADQEKTRQRIIDRAPGCLNSDAFKTRGDEFRALVNEGYQMVLDNPDGDFNVIGIDASKAKYDVINQIVSHL